MAKIRVNIYFSQTGRTEKHDLDVHFHGTKLQTFTLTRKDTSADGESLDACHISTFYRRRNFIVGWDIPNETTIHFVPSLKL